MQYVWITYLSHDEDDPAESYVELGDDLRERRRIDQYQNGMCFAYGEEHGAGRRPFLKRPIRRTPTAEQARRGGRQAHLRPGLSKPLVPAPRASHRLHGRHFLTVRHVHPRKDL